MMRRAAAARKLIRADPLMPRAVRLDLLALVVWPELSARLCDLEGRH